MQLAPLALALTTLFIDGWRTAARRQKLHPRQGKGVLGEGQGECCAAAPRPGAAGLGHFTQRLSPRSPAAGEAQRVRDRDSYPSE